MNQNDISKVGKNQKKQAGQVRVYQSMRQKQSTQDPKKRSALFLALQAVERACDTRNVRIQRKRDRKMKAFTSRVLTLMTIRNQFKKKSLKENALEAQTAHTNMC